MLRVSIVPCLTLFCLFQSTPFLSAAEAESPAALVQRIKAVGSEGTGNREASAAWKALVAIGVEAMIPTLAGMDDAKPVSRNWLRLAAQAIAEREEQAKRPLPAASLEAFVKEAKHAPVGRRLAYDLLVRADPKAPERLLPGMVEDPSVELRRDAIETAIERATPLIAKDPTEAATEFGKLFRASRDLDQAEKIAKTLKALKVTPDVNAHFGVLADWMVIGPFDGPKGAGYLTAFEPESKVDLAATYPGKGGMELKWAAHRSPEPYGVVDFNKALGKHKEAVAFAFAAIDSEKAQPVEIRFGCIAAVKIFLNGKEMFAREEYHHGQRFDQYAVLGNLKAGRNEILVKVCQNNQTEGWAQDWKFQLRLCDFTGGALPVAIIENPKR